MVKRLTLNLHEHLCNLSLNPGRTTLFIQGYDYWLECEVQIPHRIYGMIFTIAFILSESMMSSTSIKW